MRRRLNSLARPSTVLPLSSEASSGSGDVAASHVQAGLACLRRGEYEEAQEEFRQAIERRPDYAAAHAGLGLACFALGDRDGAWDQYRILRGLDPYLAAKLLEVLSA